MSCSKLFSSWRANSLAAMINPYRLLRGVGVPVAVGVQARSVTRSYNSNASVELFYNAQAQIAGSPFYERRANQLLWVDSWKKTINFLSLDTKKSRSVRLPDTVGAAIPIARSNMLVALVGKKICVVDRGTGAVVKVLATADDDGSLTMGRCDRLGRLWCTVAGDKAASQETSVGQLLSYAPVNGKLHHYYTQPGITGGMEWDDDYTRMFCIDSLSRKVYSFDFDESTQELDSQQLLVDYTKDSALGYPNGVCRDVLSNLWVGGYLGGNVSYWDTDTGKMLSQLSVPAKRVTACCYGGPNYEWLFIFTSRENADETELSTYPNSGAIFVAKDTGTQGVPKSKLRTEAIRVYLQ